LLKQSHYVETVETSVSTKQATIWLSMAGGVPLAEIKHASTLGNAFPAFMKEVIGQNIHHNIYSSCIRALQNAMNKRIVTGRVNMRPGDPILCL
jgi:hypothetical protein